MMAESFMRMFRAGPEVSLKGSPTVSPTTAALWSSVPLRPLFSIHFLALSQAPPALLRVMAIIAPATMVPPRTPSKHRGPTRKPTMNGVRTAMPPGSTISSMELCVEMAMHSLWSGCCEPSMMPGRSWNCRRTTRMMAPAAFCTLSMVRPAKRNGSMPPSSAPPSTMGSASRPPWPALSAKAVMSETEVSTALPMAKPLPVAAVVFPRASRASVVERTLSGSSAISAMPPELSAMGPYASVASVTPRVDNMPTAATAMP
mmetsp:Transcript_22617/g.70070  ORF Transcript_22617/g.70070 Transcript_22617/m.70070 type:complete len:259 (-) Transcript_22617:1703-2479(-)